MIRLPPRRLGVAAAVGLVAGGLAAAVLFAPGRAAKTKDCIEQAAAEFGELPLGSKVDSAILAQDDRTTNTCRQPSDLGESCGFQGVDAVAYDILQEYVLNKELRLSDRPTTRAPLGLTRATRISEARRRLERMGAGPSSVAEEDGTSSLVTSLCPVWESSSWFTIKFDVEGRARAVELSSMI